MYYTCRKTPYPESAFREYQEPENLTEPDDGVDGQFGVFCEDAGFNPRPWPKEEECVKVPTCKELPTPGIDIGVDRATSQLVLAWLEPDFDGSARLVEQCLAQPNRFFDSMIWLKPKSCNSLAP